MAKALQRRVLSVHTFAIEGRFYSSFANKGIARSNKFDAIEGRFDCLYELEIH